MKTPARITNRPFCRQLVQHVTRARPFSRTAIGAMAATNKVKFAEGSDEAALTKVLDGLTSGTPKWSLTPNGQGVERSFKFKTFAKTWDFMTAVSLQCKLKNHHPEWSNVYNSTFIRWTTHSHSGLSAKDTLLAALCDELARDFGEIRDDGAVETSSKLKDLLDQTAGDCCTPNKP